MPGAVKVATVAAAKASLKMTVPGPLTMLHETSSVLPRGSPSSVAVPLSTATFGSVTSWSGPALTTGGSFFRTVMTTSSKTVNSVSLALRRRV